MSYRIPKRKKNDIEKKYQKIIDKDSNEDKIENNKIQKIEKCVKSTETQKKYNFSIKVNHSSNFKIRDTIYLIVISNNDLYLFCKVLNINFKIDNNIDTVYIPKVYIKNNTVIKLDINGFYEDGSLIGKNCISSNLKLEEFIIYTKYENDIINLIKKGYCFDKYKYIRWKYMYQN